MFKIIIEKYQIIKRGIIGNLTCAINLSDIVPTANEMLINSINTRIFKLCFFFAAFILSFKILSLLELITMLSKSISSTSIIFSLIILQSLLKK